MAENQETSMELVSVEGNFKWTAQHISVFLEHLINYPALWDMDSADYKARACKIESWNNLGKGLVDAGFPESVANIDLLKKKLKNVRDTYAVELGKVKKSKGTGTSKKEVYKPTLPWYDAADLFLRKSCNTRKSISTLSTDIQENHEDDSGEQDLADFTPTTIRTPSPSYYIGSSAYNRTSHKKLKSDAAVDGAITRLERLSSLKNDEFDGFGKTIAAQLRRLPEEIAWETQDKMTKLMRDAIVDSRKNNTVTQRSAAKSARTELTSSPIVIDEAGASHTSSIEPSSTPGIECDNDLPQTGFENEEGTLTLYDPDLTEATTINLINSNEPSVSNLNKDLVVDTNPHSTNLVPLNSAQNRLNILNNKTDKSKSGLRVRTVHEIEDVMKAKQNKSISKDSSAIAKLVALKPGFAKILGKKGAKVPLMAPKNITQIKIVKKVSPKPRPTISELVNVHFSDGEDE